MANTFITRVWFVVVVLVPTVTVPVYAELILELSHRARDIHPGEVVVLEVRPSENPTTLSATAFGKSLRFSGLVMRSGWRFLVLI